MKWRIGFIAISVASLVLTIAVYASTSIASIAMIQEAKPLTRGSDLTSLFSLFFLLLLPMFSVFAFLWILCTMDVLAHGWSTVLWLLLLIIAPAPLEYAVWKKRSHSVDSLELMTSRSFDLDVVKELAKAKESRERKQISQTSSQKILPQGLKGKLDFKGIGQ